MLFWRAADLEGKLLAFRNYYNEHRTRPKTIRKSAFARLTLCAYAPSTRTFSASRGAVIGASIRRRRVGGGRAREGVRRYGRVVVSAQDRRTRLDLVVVCARVHELGGVGTLLRHFDLVVLTDRIEGR